jgi:hypothetical protein
MDNFLVIDNRPFIIDLEKNELRQYNRSANTIAFNTLSHSGFLFSLELNGRPLKIPQTLLQIPDQLTPLMRTAINLRSRDENWGIYIGDEAVARRLSGELPHIDISGTDFTIDWRLREMRETSEPWKSIKINDLDMTEDYESYGFFYDTVNHTVFDFDEKVTEMPENVVIAEIPNEYRMDPVAVAREQGLGEAELLAQNPIVLKHSAAIKPITGIGLEAFIEENRQRLNESPSRKNSR